MNQKSRCKHFMSLHFLHQVLLSVGQKQFQPNDLPNAFE